MRGSNAFTGVGVGLLFNAMLANAALSQQFVIDTAFCKAVSDNECIDPIPSGDTIDLSELQKDKNGPLLHFWGALRNPSRSVVGHFFARGGDCYEERKTVGVSKARAANPAWRSFVNWARTRTLDDLTSFFLKDIKGEAKINLQGVDVKISGAVAEPSERFRVFTFRNVLCEGRVEARLLDSQGVPIVPDSTNDVKFLTLTNNTQPGNGVSYFDKATPFPSAQDY
jgi:hypothetical protein